MAPASRARSTSSRWLKAVSTITGAIRSPAICSAARQAVEDRHLDVEDDQVGAQLRRPVDGLLPVADLGDDRVPLLLEHLLEVEADECLVLGDEDPRSARCSRAEPSHVGRPGTSPLRCSRRRAPHRRAPVPQSAEGADSKPAQCAFESHRGHLRHDMCDPPDRTAATVPFPGCAEPTPA